LFHRRRDLLALTEDGVEGGAKLLPFSGDLLHLWSELFQLCGRRSERDLHGSAQVLLLVERGFQAARRRHVAHRHEQRWEPVGMIGQGHTQEEDTAARPRDVVDLELRRRRAAAEDTSRKIGPRRRRRIAWDPVEQTCIEQLRKFMRAEQGHGRVAYCEQRSIRGDAHQAGRLAFEQRAKSSHFRR
jgi:hypothetical protein